MHTLWKNMGIKFIMQTGWAFAYFSPSGAKKNDKKCWIFQLKMFVLAARDTRP